MVSPQDQKLQNEIEQLEEKIFGTPEPPVGDPPEEEKAEVAEEEKVVQPEPQAAPAEKPPEAPVDTAEELKQLKQRYSSLRTHHDGLVYQLRKENASLKESLAGLQTKMAELMKKAQKHDDTHDDLFTEEEKAILGPEAVAAMAKATRKVVDSKVSTIQKELEEERLYRQQQQLAEADRSKKEASDILRRRLASLVPGFEELDVDPNFHKFMEQADPFSGLARVQLFNNAVASGDVGRVAEFFVEYQRATAPPKSNPMEKRITPTGSTPSVSESGSKSEKLTWAYVDRFYSDVQKGKYRGKQRLQDEIEARIDRAISRGEVAPR
jgi:hypothetical protein